MQSQVLEKMAIWLHNQCLSFNYEIKVIKGFLNEEISK
jgi:hypothetical protein